MKIKETDLKPFTLYSLPFTRCGWRRGQTAVEYLLVTVALTVAFATAFRVLQWYLANEFKRGGVIILKMYHESPW